MSLAMTANAILVSVSTLLSLVLVVLYARMLAELRSRFTLGLLLFAAVLLAQNLVQLYFFATMMDYYAGNVENLVLAQNAMQAAALAFLTVVTVSPAGRVRLPRATRA